MSYQRGGHSGRGNFRGGERDHGGVGGMNISSEEKVGCVVNIRDSYGFIQPWDKDNGDGSAEQIFFHCSEAYPEVMIGHEVKYYIKRTPRGNQAVNLTKVLNELKLTIPGIKGVIIKEYDNHKHKPGEIKIEMSGIQPNLPTGIILPTFCIYTMYNTSKLASKGDIIEFELVKLLGCDSYNLARNINVTVNAKERAIQEQIKTMTESGIPRLQGFIENISSNRDYGFIKPADRTENIYFRLDDSTNNVESNKLQEGVEVDFFVIAENVRGKLSDRAFHINILPKGTISLEITLATACIATVVIEGTMYPKEEPGLVALHSPITGNDNNLIKEVQLWGRCVSDNLILRCGDVISLKVQYYRPEKLIFARDVNIISYRSYGRETGTVGIIKDQADKAYGFIKCNHREGDLYFRTNEVMDITTNKMLDESVIGQNLKVAFDVSDESRNQNKLLRAVRIRLIDDVNTTGVAGPCLQSNCYGSIIKVAKKDSPGIIAINSTKSNISSTAIDSFSTPQYIILSLRQFEQDTFLNDITIDSLTGIQIAFYHKVLCAKFPSLSHAIVHKSSNGSPIDSSRRLLSSRGSNYHSIKIWKNSNNLSESCSSKEIKCCDTHDISDMQNMITNFKEIVYHFKDIDEQYGPLYRSSEVKFALHSDIETNCKLACDVTLTDEPVNVDGIENSLIYGIIDAIQNTKSGKIGFIRAIPTDEKLQFHILNIDKDANRLLNEKSLVSFNLRKRGGIRTAVNISSVSPSSIDDNTSPGISTDIILPGICKGIVVNLNSPSTGSNNLYGIVLVDVNSCDLLKEKYLNYSTVDDAINSTVFRSYNDGNDSSIIFDNNNDIKHFPLLHRLPTPIPAMYSDLQLGDVIECQAVAQWSIQRHPIRIENIRIISANNQKKLGIILRPKVTARIGTDKTVELVEIMEYNASDNATTNANNVVYCDYRELTNVDNDYNVEVGVEVEYFNIPDSKFAAQVVLQATRRDVSGILFRRAPVNALLKETKSKGGIKGILMAEGPPDTEDNGFKEGWRITPDISNLSWKKLLE